MTANSNSLPISVVSAIVARFDGDHEEIKFHGDNNFRIHINSWEFNSSDSCWNIHATWNSKLPMDIIVDKNFNVSAWAVFQDNQWWEGS